MEKDRKHGQFSGGDYKFDWKTPIDPNFKEKYNRGGKKPKDPTAISLKEYNYRIVKHKDYKMIENKFTDKEYIDGKRVIIPNHIFQLGRSGIYKGDIACIDFNKLYLDILLNNQLPGGDQLDKLPVGADASNYYHIMHIKIDYFIKLNKDTCPFLQLDSHGGVGILEENGNFLQKYYKFTGGKIAPYIIEEFGFKKDWSFYSVGTEIANNINKGMLYGEFPNYSNYMIKHYKDIVVKIVGCFGLEDFNEKKVEFFHKEYPPAAFVIYSLASLKLGKLIAHFEELGCIGINSNTDSAGFVFPPSFDKEKYLHPSKKIGDYKVEYESCYANIVGSGNAIFLDSSYNIVRSLHKSIATGSTELYNFEKNLIDKIKLGNEKTNK